MIINPYVFAAPAGPFGGAVSTTGLQEWWPLNEASGNALGSDSSLTLTDVNGCGASTGPGGSGTRVFAPGSAQYFSRTSEAALQMGDIDCFVTVWFYLNSLGATRVIVGKDTAAAGGREWTVYLTSANNPRFIAFDGTSVVGSIIHSTTVSVSTWYCLLAYHSATANEVGMSINGAAYETAATTGAPATTSTQFRLGNDARGASNPYWDGQINRCGYFKRLPDAGDPAAFYNSGNGLDY